MSIEGKADLYWHDERELSEVFIGGTLQCAVGYHESGLAVFAKPLRRSRLPPSHHLLHTSDYVLDVIQ